MFDKLGASQPAEPTAATPQSVATHNPAAEAPIAQPAAQEPIPAEQSATPAPAATTEPAAAPATTQEPTPNTATPATDATPAQPLDFNSAIDKMSGGVIKDEIGLKASLEKLNNYETLVKERDDLSAKMAAAPTFADDEVRIYNDLKKAGASKEQLKAFQQINQYGAIAEMPDKEALIAKMVMIDGVKPSVAELKVNRQYKLGDDTVAEEDRELLDDDQRVDATNARKELEKFKAQASQINQPSQEEQQLQQQAALKNHQDRVKPYANDVANLLPNMGTYNLSGLEGDKAVAFEVPITPEARAFMANAVENFFMDGLTPPTEENTRLALNYARAEYLRENQEAILREVYKKAVSKTTEELVAKYENRSGLKPQQDNPVVGAPSDAQAMANFATKVANRTVGQ